MFVAGFQCTQSNLIRPMGWQCGLSVHCFGPDLNISASHGKSFKVVVAPCQNLLPCDPDVIFPDPASVLILWQQF